MPRPTYLKGESVMNEISDNTINRLLADLISQMINSADDILKLCYEYLETDLASPGYPQYLPSLDEFINDLIVWRDTQKLGVASSDE